MGKEYIKRQLVLHDIGIEINSDVKSYYDFIKKIVTIDKIVDRDNGDQFYYNKGVLILIYKTYNNILIDKNTILEFCYNFNIRDFNICKNIIKYVVEHILNIPIFGVVDVQFR